MRPFKPEDKQIQFYRGYTPEIIQPFIKPPQETHIENRRLSLFQLLKQDWKHNLVFIGISITKASLIGYGLINIEGLIRNSDEGLNPIKDFSIHVLAPFIGAKLLHAFNHFLITRGAINQIIKINTALIERYFSSKRPQNEENIEVNKLIFENFDFIRPSLITVHEDIIFKIFEMMIYGGIIIWSEKCQWPDVAMISGFSSFAAIVILGVEMITGRSKKVSKNISEAMLMLIHILLGF